MKGNIKRLAVLVIITVMATFMMAATVTARSRNHRFIQGQYAATGSVTCLVAELGFDNLVPVRQACLWCLRVLWRVFSSSTATGQAMS